MSPATLKDVADEPEQDVVVARLLRRLWLFARCVVETFWRDIDLREVATRLRP